MLGIDEKDIYKILIPQTADPDVIYNFKKKLDEAIAENVELTEKLRATTVETEKIKEAFDVTNNLTIHYFD